MLASQSTVYVTNGLTLAGVNGTGTGTINLTRYGSTLYVEGSETIDNATINIGNNSTCNDLYNYDYGGAATLLSSPDIRELCTRMMQEMQLCGERLDLRIDMTPEERLGIALRLGKFFGVDPRWFMNMQTQYDLQIEAARLVEKA